MPGAILKGSQYNGSPPLELSGCETTNQTSEGMNWNFNVSVNISEPVHLEIQSQGKDTHPESDYGDYVIMEADGYTQATTICKIE